VKARAEGLNLNAKVGLLTRVERLIILIVSFIFNIPMVGLWVIAILANFTAIQRLLFVRKQVIK
jgi:CDP-diacylglycerol--glycerol-3-phosphate 3-phosphatidyltransferase